MPLNTRSYKVFFLQKKPKKLNSLNLCWLPFTKEAVLANLGNAGSYSQVVTVYMYVHGTHDY